jgi:hypothetical protein
MHLIKVILFISGQMNETDHHQAIDRAFVAPTFIFCFQQSALLDFLSNFYSQFFASPQLEHIMLKLNLDLNLYSVFFMSSQS